MYCIPNIISTFSSNADQELFGKTVRHKNLKIKRNMQTEVDLVRFRTSTLIDRRFTCKTNENNDHV